MNQLRFAILMRRPVLEQHKQAVKKNAGSAMDPDHLLHLKLVDSVPLIGADQVWPLQDGSGQAVTGQGGLAGPLTARWGDELVIKGGLLLTAIGFILLLLADTFVTILLATAFFGLGTALQIPALTSLTSKRATVPQGIVMGLSNSFVSLGRIFGPVFGGAIFDINIFLPYLGGSAIMGIGFIVSLMTLKEVKLEKDSLSPG